MVMEIKSKTLPVNGIKFYIEKDGKEIARAYLYILKNELHEQPFAFMEDVFVQESFRGQGLGTKLVEHIINKAKEMECYKLICTSRFTKPKVHELYKRLGFKEHGVEFRIDFK